MGNSMGGIKESDRLAARHMLSIELGGIKGDDQQERMLYGIAKCKINLVRKLANPSASKASRQKWSSMHKAFDEMLKEINQA